MNGKLRCLCFQDWTQEQYINAYENGYALAVNKDIVFDHVVDKFDTFVFEELKDTFHADREFNLLGIGVGRGR